MHLSISIFIDCQCIRLYFYLLSNSIKDLKSTQCAFEVPWYLKLWIYAMENLAQLIRKTSPFQFITNKLHFQSKTGNNVYGLLHFLPLSLCICCVLLCSLT